MHRREASGVYCCQVERCKYTKNNCKMIKRTKKNYKLTTNIWFYEYMQGTAMPLQAIIMAWECLTDEVEQNIKDFAPVLQGVRDWVNDEFTSDKDKSKDIGIEITCGFRPLKWELMQKRSGKSQHTKCAVDFNFTNCSLELEAKIIKAVYNKFDNERWMGGLAIKKPSYNESGKIFAVGFIHIDPREPDAKELSRGFGARWEYK